MTRKAMTAAEAYYTALPVRLSLKNQRIGSAEDGA